MSPGASVREHRSFVQGARLKTEIYEADPFTSRKGKLLATFNSDYRFERQDELIIDGAERPTKVRVIGVLLRLSGGDLQRELLVMKL